MSKCLGGVLQVEPHDLLVDWPAWQSFDSDSVLAVRSGRQGRGAGRRGRTGSWQVLRYELAEDAPRGRALQRLGRHDGADRLVSSGRVLLFLSTGPKNNTVEIVVEANDDRDA